MSAENTNTEYVVLIPRVYDSGWSVKSYHTWREAIAVVADLEARGEKGAKIVNTTRLPQKTTIS